MISHYSYTAYQLTFHSDIYLGEMQPGDGPADVVIRFGKVPPELDGVDDNNGWFQASENQLLLRVEGIARYWIRNGNEIVIDPLSGSEERDVRVYLLGSCLGALLHQRGILALHASAVQAGKKALLFTGYSGSGKSTLLNVFLQRGYKMLTDDVCGIVAAEDGRPVVLPGIPRCKLWDDAAAHLGVRTRGLEQVYSKERKYALLTNDQFVNQPVPLSSVFLLRPHQGDDLIITPLEGVDRLAVLVEQTFRPQFLDGLNKRAAHFRMAAELSSQIEFYLIDAPRRRFSSFEIATCIENLTPNSYGYKHE